MNDPIQPSKNINHLKEILSQLEQLPLTDQAKPLIVEIQESVTSLESELYEKDSALDSTQQDKAKFVSVVTHELRIPLTSIKGYTDLMRQELVGPVNEQQSNFLSIIRTNVDRMAALIADLADMSHIQSGRITPQTEVVNPKNLINEITFVWKARFEEKQQDFIVQAEDFNTELRIDKDRFKQILNYLLSNANRFTPEKERIVLSLGQTENGIRVEIQDNGIGIKPEDQEKLFTPFFRSEDEAVREHHGWGLSLYVAKLLVELLGGKIGVKSQEGSGSLFWFEIPAYA